VAERLSTLRQRFTRSATGLTRVGTVPVLLWNDAPPAAPKPLLFTTVPKFRQEEAGPPAHDPLVFELVKGSAKSNAFALGITLGRASSNDIPVEQSSVSRFHCYFQQDSATGIWHLVDAESFNGTYLEGARLAPNRPAPLTDRARIGFGSVEMRFFSPQSFVDLLRQRTSP
jgi:hypothetical protein